MATATMGLRRRVHQVSTTSSTPSTSSTSTNTGASTSSNNSGHSSGGGSKRTRSDNNNSPSQGNLNSPEPAPKKARNSSRVAAAKAKELEMAKKVTPPHWSDTRQFASIAGLSLQDQAALCSNALPSPVSYLSSQMATFVGNAAASLGKGPGAAVSYLDISNMTAGAGPRPNWPNQDASTADPISLAFSAAAAFPSTSKSNSSSSSTPATSTATSETATSPQQQSAITLPKNFPNDAMFNTYQPWVIKTYGDLAKTKTITIKKYARILRTLRGEEVNSAENSKFRFWVKSKGFHIGQPEGYEAKPADRIIGRHAVTTPGLDPPLYVPTQPPHNKALNGAEGTVSPGRVYKKVAIVENFFDIIHAVHVDLEGRPGKHAGQKRTYRTITETYAFLPREAVTRFLLGCTECQRRPRTPSPTTTAAGTTTTKPGSPSPTASPSPTPDEKKDEPASPKPSLTSVTNGVAKGGATAADASYTEKPADTSAACTESKSGVAESEDKTEVSKTTETMTPTTTSTTSIAATTMPSSDANKSNEASGSNNSSSSNNNSSSSSSEIKASSEISTTSLGNSNNPNEAAKFKARDEKYNPLSITNLLRKDPVKRRSPPIITTAYQPFPTSDAYAYTMTATTAMSTDNRSSPSSTYIRKLHGEDRVAACTPIASAAVASTVTRPWSPSRVESKYSPLDYSRPLVPEQAQTKTTATNPHAEPVKKEIQPQSLTTTTTVSSTNTSTAAAAPVVSLEKAGLKSIAEVCKGDNSEMEENAFSPTAGLIDTNLNLLATIQQLHCQVMLALTERLRPAVATSPAATDS